MDWISCKDQLPEDGEEVRVKHMTGALIWTPLNEGRCTDSHISGNWEKHEGITHWMPLPPPPTLNSWYSIEEIDRQLALYKNATFIHAKDNPD